jgi:hypothetical protein
MFNEKGDLSYERLRWARNRPAQNWVQFGGIQFNAESATSFIYGAASGLQYDGMNVDADPAKAAVAAANAVASNCFYSAYGLMDTFDLLIHDATHMFLAGNFNWFNTVMYDPFHLTGDLSVVYS